MLRLRGKPDRPADAPSRDCGAGRRAAPDPARSSEAAWSAARAPAPGARPAPPGARPWSRPRAVPGGAAAPPGRCPTAGTTGRSGRRGCAGRGSVPGGPLRRGLQALHLRAPGRSVGDVVVLGLDLDPDVEHFGGLALAGAHEVEVADEAPDRGRGQALGAGLVADFVVERRDLGEQVRLGLGVDRFDREAPGRGGQQVESTVGVAAGLADLGEGADAGQRRFPGRADLAAVADQDDPERLAACRGSAGSSPGSDPRRCAAAGRCPDRAPCAAGRAGSPSTTDP